VPSFRGIELAWRNLRANTWGVWDVVFEVSDRKTGKVGEPARAMTEAEILKARKEAEDRCADPEKCREANRKAYAAVVDFKRARDLIMAAKLDVVRSLRDPASAIFDDVFYSKKNGEAVCGHVNAKNGFGGHTGMEPFVINVAKGKLLMSNTAAWNKHCAGAERIAP